MMLHTQSPRQRYLKLLALVPIVAVALAVNAEKVTDVVYTNAETPSEESLSNEMVATAEPQLAGPEAVVADDNKKFIAEGAVYDLGEANDDGIYQISPDKATPIVGAVVQVVGSKKGVVTGKDGKFKIEVSEGDDLQISYVGYETTKIALNKAYSDKGNQYMVGLLKEGRSSKANANGVFDVVDEMPQFPGGASKLFEFIAQNVKYPKEAENAGIQGRVIATFVVEKDGSISEAKVVKSVNPLLDAEALRVINAMPNWTPGKQRGEAVRVKYTVPVSFHLQGDKAPVTQYEANLNYDGDGKKKLSEVVVVAYGPNKEAKPLVYVDGKEIPFEDINKVDPKTIEQMNIVKDKVAIKKYGEKAKDGVILITTKKQ